MLKLPVTTCTVVALLMATQHDISAQNTQAALAVGGGVATDARGISSRAATIAPSLSWDVDPRLSFGVAASGTRFENQQWSLTGSALAAARLPLGSFTAMTFNGSAGTTGTSYDATYATMDALPALELHAGPVAAFAGARAQYGRTTLVTQTQTPVGTLPGSSSSTSQTRSALGPVFGVSASTTSDDQTLVVGYREEHASILHVPSADRTVTASVSNGRLTIGGSYGARFASDGHTTFGNGSMSVVLLSSTALEIGGGTYASNRLTGLPGGRYLNIGLSIRTGSMPAAAEVRLPTAAGAPAVARGYTRLSIRADDGSRVELAGDWNGWTPQPARRAANGVWYADAKIPPGRYRYAFRVNGHEWRVPDGAAAVSDEFGGKSAWLTVSASQPTEFPCVHHQYSRRRP